MNYSDEYRARLCTADEAVRLVKNGDWVDYASNNAKPVLLDRALARRRDELHGVKIRGNLTPGPLAVVECDPEVEHFVYHTWHCSGYERKLCDAGRAFFTPMIFRNLGWYYRTQLTVNVAMFCVSPMDSHGYFSFGGSTGVCRDIADTADVIILEVNEAVPRVLGEGESIHISEVTHVVEAGRLPLWDMQSPEPSETDTMIARHIFPHIHDGATVQLGIGGMPAGSLRSPTCTISACTRSCAPTGISRCSAPVSSRTAASRCTPARVCTGSLSAAKSCTTG